MIHSQRQINSEFEFIVSKTSPMLPEMYDDGFTVLFCVHLCIATLCLSFAYEVGSIGLHFAFAYALQRNCRYSSCGMYLCGCSCCCFGLYAGPADAERHDFLASKLVITDVGARLRAAAAAAAAAAADSAGSDEASLVESKAE